MDKAFTRDLFLVRESAQALPTHDLTNFEALLSGIDKLVADTWGSSNPIQIFLVTDGSLGMGRGSLRDLVRRRQKFSFPAKMNILALGKFCHHLNIKLFSQNYC